MTESLQSRALELARRLLDLPEHERVQALHAACGEDAAWSRLTQALLDADASHDTLLDKPLGFDVYAAAGSAVGSIVGPYRVLAELGRGGMGAVYRAERVDGITGHHVALKTIKRGMDSEEIVRRFRQEREMLARLAHPNIARLLDGGVADDGQLWFAMELVDGRPITQACDDERLGLRDRIRRFVAVAEAVQFAHANLIVHRDLKPNNVLVGADGEPKLLDFGIGKLLDVGDASQTQSQLRMLTPEFAAPEQRRGEPITIATDIYQLGLLLFELLIGRRAPIATPQHAIPRLSSAIASWRAEDPTAAEAAASRRGTTARALQRTVAGDLDHIVERALEEEPARRYESAAAIAADLTRYLEGRAVHAVGTAWTYRARRFARRNRVAVGAAALVVLAICVGIAGVLWQARRAQQAAERARAEAATSSHVKDFLVDVFRTASPEEALGRPLTAREMVDIGARRVGFELGTEPSVQIAMYGALGEIYGGLGDKPAAAAAFRSALQRAEHERVDAATLDELRVDLAGALFGAETKPGVESDEAAHLLDAVLARSTGSGMRAELDIRARVARGGLFARLGNRAEAEATLRDAVSRARELGPQGDVALADALVGLGENLQALERCVDAVPLFREALAIRERASDRRSPSVTEAQHELAMCLSDEGEPADAEPILREVLATDREVLGDNHPETAQALHTLGTVLLDERKNAEAKTLLVQALGIFEQRYGADSEPVATASNSLCVLEANMREFDQAIAYGRRAAAIWAHDHGETYEYALLARYNTALAQFNSGDYAGAEAEFLRVRDLRAQAGLMQPTWLLNQLGRARRVAGDPSAAKALSAQAIEVAEGGNGDESFDTVSARLEVALDERDLGDIAGARRDQTHALDQLVAAFPNAKTMISDARLMLGELDLAEGRCATALPVFQQALDERGRREPRDAVRVDEAHFLIARCASTKAAAGEQRATAKLVADAPRADPFLRRMAHRVLGGH